MTVSLTQGGLTITPTRELGLAYLHLRELIADSEVWQEVVADPTGTITEVKAASGASRANALTAIHLYQIHNEAGNDEHRIAFPTCLIEFQNGEQLAERYGPGAFFIKTAFYVEFCFQTPVEYKGLPGLAHLDAAEKADEIRQWMMFPDDDSERYVIESMEMMRLQEIESNVIQGLRGYAVEFLVNAESAQA